MLVGSSKFSAACSAWSGQYRLSMSYNRAGGIQYVSPSFSHPSCRHSRSPAGRSSPNCRTRWSERIRGRSMCVSAGEPWRTRDTGPASAVRCDWAVAGGLLRKKCSGNPRPRPVLLRQSEGETRYQISRPQLRLVRSGRAGYHATGAVAIMKARRPGGESVIQTFHQPSIVLV